MQLHAGNTRPCQNQLILPVGNAGPWEQDWEIPVILGYNGIEFFNDEKKITAFKGQMKIVANGKTDTKTDLGRQLEIMILKNAPAQYKDIAWQQLAIDFD